MRIHCSVLCYCILLSQGSGGFPVFFFLLFALCVVILFYFFNYIFIEYSLKYKYSTLYILNTERSNIKGNEKERKGKKKKVDHNTAKTTEKALANDIWVIAR